MTELPMAQPRAVAPPRKVGFLLGMGIMFFPFICVWFLLRAGHSTLARIVGFGWFGLLLLFAIASQDATPPTSQGTTSAQTEANKPKTEAEQRADAFREVKRSPENFLNLERINGKKGGFETILILNGRISNSSEFDIKDPVLKCEINGASGTRINTVSETLYEVIPAKGMKSFTDLNMGFMGGAGQASGFSCAISSATLDSAQ